MKRNLTNLLPTERARAFRQGYFLRLAALSATMVAALIAIQGALLVPAYTLVTSQVSVAEERLAALSESDASTQEAAIGARIGALSKDATRLLTLSKGSEASAVLSALTAVAHPGISLSGMAYAPSHGAAADGTLVVRGVAANRESLRSYVTALSALPFVATVDIPLSVYAKESDISFSLTLKGTLTP